MAISVQTSHAPKNLTTKANPESQPYHAAEQSPFSKASSNIQSFDKSGSKLPTKFDSAQQNSSRSNELKDLPFSLTPQFTEQIEKGSSTEKPDAESLSKASVATHEGSTTEEFDSKSFDRPSVTTHEAISTEKFDSELLTQASVAAHESTKSTTQNTEEPASQTTKSSSNFSNIEPPVHNKSSSKLEMILANLKNGSFSPPFETSTSFLQGSFADPSEEFRFSIVDDDPEDDSPELEVINEVEMTSSGQYLLFE